MESIFDPIFIQDEQDIPTTAAAETSTLRVTTMTLAEHDQIFKDIRGGTITEADEVRNHFERLCRDYPAIALELKKFKKDQIKDRVAGFFRPDTKKEGLIDDAIDAMFNSYGFLTIPGQSMISSGIGRDSYITRNRNRLAALTNETLAAYRQVHLDRIAECVKAVQARKAAVADPQTIADFETFFRVNGKEKLTPTLQVRYDTLVADKLKAEQEAKRAQNAIIQGVSAGCSGKIIEAKHTRDGHHLYIVQLEQRVEASEFKRLSDICKRLSGYYSSYRGNGATPGFQFKARENADQFLKAISGEDLDVSELAKERQQQKVESAAERLVELGEKSEDRALGVLDRDRKTNTSRRAAIASSIENAARDDLAIAKTIQNVGDAMRNGELTYLTDVRFKTQIELLTGLLNRAKYQENLKKYNSYQERQAHKDDPITADTVFFVDFPRYFVEDNVLDHLAEKLSKVNGLKRVGTTVEKLAWQFKRNKDLKIDHSLFDTICARVNNNEKIIHWNWVGTAADRSRLFKMNIQTPEQLRMACRELVQQLEEKEKADRAKELERKLIGTTVGIDFFPTKSSYARYMVQVAGVTRGKSTLEPQAGNGMIAAQIRNAGVEPDVCEISSSLREILLEKKFNIVGSDFLDLKDREYDCIVANPPFSNNQDIIHTRHAYSLLAEKGCLTTIVGEGAFYRSGATETAFRSWLEVVGATVETVPEDTFSDPELMVNTKARARLVIIRR